jgi:hypothetical protein
MEDDEIQIITNTESSPIRNSDETEEQNIPSVSVESKQKTKKSVEKKKIQITENDQKPKKRKIKRN